ncbi:hypothetical protein HDU76_010066 [Blyttiomyces sp. JEL0837]|nr:hypothetical protein HDU76_010066 [Blyttiomyces sp. JEL0837]
MIFSTAAVFLAVATSTATAQIQTTCAFLQSSTTQVAFTDIVTFGASYMDSSSRNDMPPKVSAAMAATMNGLTQASGRASNGPTFVEYLAGDAGAFANFSNFAPGGCVGGLLNAKLHDLAISGATCDYTIFGKPANTQPLSVVQQVSNALTSGLLSTLNPATTLFIMLPATADMASQPGTTQDPAIAAALSGCYQNVITTLITQLGAKHFVLGNMYPFDLAPQNAASTPQQLQLIKSRVQSLNLLLSQVPSLIKSQFATANIWKFDAEYAVRNYLIPFASFFYGPNANVVAGCNANLAACTVAGPDSYLFWDVHHPTRATHRYFAQIIYMTLTMTPSTGPVV